MTQLPGELASRGLDALESLLQQAEQSTSHYEALNIERCATAAQIADAYDHASAVLQPVLATLEVEGDLVIEVRERVERAISRLTHAHTVLSNSKKRAAYDRFAVVKKTGPLLSQIDLQSNKASASAVPESEAEENRRRNRRFPMAIPSIVVGYDRKTGKWEDCVETVDVSRTGITLRMSRRVRHGNVLHLALSLPDCLRDHDMEGSDYRVYGVVRRVQPVKDDVRITAVEFIGEHPPVGYLDKPWATFDAKPWSGSNRRREPRHPGSETVWVEYFNENLQCLRQGAGQTEDVSEGGLRVMVKAAPPEFEFVRVSYPERGIESYAVVCNRFTKRDGLERLCLQLIDNSHLVECTVTPPDSETVAPLAAPAETEYLPGRGKHILVADDDLSLRRVLGKILTSAGYGVTLVEDGKAAVEKAAEIKPDLVITDGLMPKMHGFLVCKALKEMQPAPKVIMLTAVYTKMDYRFEARDRYGADELLTKPFEVASLLECIERHLNVMPQALAG